MILALEDDRVLRIYDSPEKAERSVEALYAEDTFHIAVDDHARPYRIEWVHPNRRGRILGLLGWAQNGEYRLVAAGQPDPALLLEAIDRAVAVEPESFATTVAELKVRFQA